MTVKRQDSIVDIVTRLWVGQSRNRGLIPSGLRIAVFQSVQTGSGALPTSCSVGNRAFSPGINLPECEADHLPLLPELNIHGAILPFLNTPSWHAWGQHGLVRKKVYSVLKQYCLFFVKLGIILNSASYLGNACFSIVIF